MAPLFASLQPSGPAYMNKGWFHSINAEQCMHMPVCVQQGHLYRHENCLVVRILLFCYLNILTIFVFCSAEIIIYIGLVRGECTHFLAIGVCSRVVGNCHIIRFCYYQLLAIRSTIIWEGKRIFMDNKLKHMYFMCKVHCTSIALCELTFSGANEHVKDPV